MTDTVHQLHLTQSSDVYAEFSCQTCTRKLAITPQSFQLLDIGDYNVKHEFDASLVEFDMVFDV